MTESQQGNKNLETTHEQVVEDAHVTISTIPKKTEVPVTSSSRSSDLASKFLNFLDIPQTDAKIVSPLDVHVHHEVPRTQAPALLTIPVSVIPESSSIFANIPQSLYTFNPTPIQATPTPPPTIETTNPLSNLPDFSSVFRFNDRITALAKEVDDLKKDPLHTQVASLVDSHLDTRLVETRQEFMNFLSESLTARIKEQRGQKDKDKDEDPSAVSDRGLNKRKLSKDAEPTTEPKKKDSTFGSSKGTKSQPKSSGKSVQSEETVFEVVDLDLLQDQAGNLGDNKDEPRGPAFRLLKGTRSNYAELEYDFEECYKALSKKLDWENPESDEYLFDLSKPLPLITRGKHQRVPFEFFINNDLKYFQGGISTMTYTTSTTKTKAVKFDLLGIEDMVLNIWSPVKVSYDKYALWGISHWREQRKSFYAFARGMQSRGDVYSTKCILAVTYVSIMKKHGYGYLEEIVVRRGDDVADFEIALRMFTRSLVIQKRVEDL
ncbi:hypothetical protein Tco_0737025 [Tanacetum coccineum]